MIKYIKILLLLIYATTIQAQSLDSLVNLAIENHPSMKVADLKIKQQELLRNSGFELEKTNFYYTGQAIGQGNDNVQHDFGVNQTFSLPKVYRAKNDLINAQIDLVKQEKVLTEIQLRKVVEMNYYQLLAANEKLKILENLDSNYQEFIKFAQLRVEVGEANPLELMNIKNEYSTFQQSLFPIQKTAVLTNNFLIFLTKQTAINTNDNGFRILNTAVNNKFEAQKQPVIQYLQQQKIIAERQIMITENELLPDFNIGYASQIFSGQAGFNLFQIGLAVPLFKKSINKRIEAARLETAIVSSRSEKEIFALELQSEQLLQEQLHLLQTLDKGEVLLQNLTETLPISKLAYENGEISYFEHLQLLKQIQETKITQIDLIQQFNKAVLSRKYLGF